MVLVPFLSVFIHCFIVFSGGYLLDCLRFNWLEWVFNSFKDLLTFTHWYFLFIHLWFFCPIFQSRELSVWMRLQERRGNSIWTLLISLLCVHCLFVPSFLGIFFPVGDWLYVCIWTFVSYIKAGWDVSVQDMTYFLIQVQGQNYALILPSEKPHVNTNISRCSWNKMLRTSPQCFTRLCKVYPVLGSAFPHIRN